MSPCRLAPYRAAAANDAAHAIRIYLWNSRLSKAFLFPLNIAEIVTRNAVHRALGYRFGGPGWVVSPPPGLLTPESEASRQRSLLRLSRILATPTPDDLVAALTFDFWSNLFRQEYDQLWSEPGLLRAAFPLLPPNEERRYVQSRVAEINHLRNRIAHHEPIHQLQLRNHFTQILETIGLQDQAIRDWVRKSSTVMITLRTPPAPRDSLPGLPLSSTNLRQPRHIDVAMPIMEAMAALSAARPHLAIVQRGVGEVDIITAQRIVDYLAIHATADGGMLDLTTHTVGDAVAGTTEIRHAVIDRTATTGDVLLAFFPPGVPQGQRPRVLLVMSEANIVGVIEHPIVRYK